MVHAPKKPAIEQIAFASGNFLLKGWLHLPQIDKPPLVIGSHGLFSDSNSPKQIQLAQQCNRKGIAFFRFDHRGCGESDAPFEEKTSLKARCADLIAAATKLKARDDLGARIGLFGSSMGGTVCLAAAGAIQPEAVVTWAAPLRSTGIGQKRTDQNSGENSGIAFKKNPFDISAQLAAVRNILILHGEADETVPASHASEIFERVGEPKKLILFPHSDHLMRNPADQQEFMRRATLWFQAHLKPA